jgi:hypothetical protein
MVPIAVLFILVGFYLTVLTAHYFQAINSPTSSGESGWLYFFVPVGLLGLLGGAVLLIIDLAYLAYFLAWVFTRKNKSDKALRLP